MTVRERFWRAAPEDPLLTIPWYVGVPLAGIAAVSLVVTLALAPHPRANTTYQIAVMAAFALLPAVVPFVLASQFRPTDGGGSA